MGIDLIHGRGPQRRGSGGLSQCRILIKLTGVTAVILRWSELQRIDEDAHQNGRLGRPGELSRRSDHGPVAVMKPAHGRHQMQL